MNNKEKKSFNEFDIIDALASVTAITLFKNEHYVDDLDLGILIEFMADICDELVKRLFKSNEDDIDALIKNVIKSSKGGKDYGNN